VGDAPYTLRFQDDAACQHDVVGGKAANLGRLTQAGFNVPAGFTVTTAAYRDFVQSAGLGGVVAEHLAALDFTDMAKLESAAADVRARFLAAAVPLELVEAISKALADLGTGSYVAVRSSGTAEDLAEASFAGQHDTYLDVHGTEQVLDAVRRCWSSLWTARAIAYRSKNKIDEARVALAVVVQTMVPSEVSGVMFTGNPLTTATDELVVNASWGLGEAVVSGITQPDEFVVKHHTLAVRTRNLGAKEVQIVRHLSGQGTAEVEVPNADRARFCLSDAQLAELGALGRSVTEYYDRIPQDIEWALVDGQFFLLQSRPITGVAFSWDEDVEPWQAHPQEDVIWSYGWTDAYWTGGVTPLFYAFRGKSYQVGLEEAHRIYRLKGAEKTQWFKYYKGTSYYQADLDCIMAEALPPSCRAMLTGFATPAAREAATAAPFSFGALAKLQARGFQDPHYNVFQFIDVQSKLIYGSTDFVDGLSTDDLRTLSDRALIRHADAQVKFEHDYCVGAMQVLQHASLVFGLMGSLLERYYRGNNPQIFADLMAGTPKQTATTLENLWLWDVATELRKSPALLALFRAQENGAFFEALEETEDGRAWLTEYRKFLSANAHRGHADRDIIYPRRIEDPSIDYNALKACLSADQDHDPRIVEEQTNARREAAVADAQDSLRNGPLGALKVEAFKLLHGWILKLLVYRDDERHFIDRNTMSIKRAFLEINRRLTQRGLVETDRDFYFLGIEELYDLFESRANLPLTRAKIAARMKDFDAVASHSVQMPPFMQHNQPVSFTDPEADDGSGVFRGVGMSGGRVTGRARVVKQLKDVGEVQHGEILVCHATDPGWTPVFLVISSVVVQTGGMLSHAACLAREYGFPAVQLTGAMTKIPDGARIVVDGDAGTVTVVDGAVDPMPDGVAELVS
jgi:pyruvate,water dikinase